MRPFRKFARQANQFSGIASKRRLSVETLEDRRLLAVVGYEPGSPTESALISFHGDDLTGKDGPLAPVGIELSLLFHEYNDFIAGGAQGEFTPSNGGLMVDGNMVTVRGIAAGDTDVLAAQLQAIGLQDIDTFESLVIGQLPIDKIDEMATLTGLRVANPQHAPISRAGIVTSQGDPAMQSDVGRDTFGVDGSGIMIGVLSDSYDSYGDAAIDIANGDLPANGVNVLADYPFASDEGRAMLQIIHDVAPGADLAFRTAWVSPIDMAIGISELATAGSDVIVDDIGWSGEPWFQDGAIAQSAAQVVESGVTYVSAAGNSTDSSYEAPFADSGIAGPLAGGILHDFDPGAGVDTLQEVTIPLFNVLDLTFQWDQPFGSLGGAGSRSDVDMMLFSADGLVDVTPAMGKANNIGGDSVEFFFFFNDGSYDFDGDGNPDETFNLSFELATGGPAPSLLKYISFGGGTFEEYTTSSGTSFGHPNAAGVGAIGAAGYYETPEFGVNPPLLQSYSSVGGIPIMFDTAGNRLATPEIRPNVSVTGPDGANTSFFTFDYEGDGFPNFFGTSAASPHVAAVAGLMLEGAGGPNSLSPATILSALESTAIDITATSDGRIIPNGVGRDDWSGAGFVDALAAISATFNGGGSKTFEGTISGTVFNDLSSDGVFDAGEPGIAGVYVYADVDNNGKIGIGEPAGVSNAAGQYTIIGVPMGSAIIREVVSPGFTPTFPVEPDHHPIEVEFDALDVVGVDFGNRASVDYGDAPAPYPTLAAAGGASHNIWPGLFLGSLVDGELNGSPDSQALGDDNAEDPFAGDTQLSGDDEDGVTFTTSLIGGQQSTIDVVASKNGILQGWIDFNGDGDWSDAGEQIVVDRALDPGTNRLSYTVPSGAVSGQTYARFRFSYERGLSYSGPTYAGEVEDYAVTIGGVAPPAPAGPPVQSDPAGNDAPAADPILRDSYHNDSNRFDIDNNGVVNPLDLVILLRDNASYNNRILHSTSQVTRGMFVDVNNDNISNPLDIVQLLRELNRLAAAAEELPEGEADYGDTMVVSMPTAVTTPILSDFVISSEWEMITPALSQDEFDNRVSTSMTSQAAAPQPNSSAATFVDLSSDGMTELLESADDDSDMAEAYIDQLFEDFATDVASQWLID